MVELDCLENSCAGQPVPRVRIPLSPPIVLTIDVQLCTMFSMAFEISFNEVKNQLLKATRGIGFDDIKDLLGSSDLLANIVHPSQRYPHQHVYVVKRGDTVYAVPYVINTQKGEIFLKTIYPSRALKRKYMKGEDS